MQVLKHFKPESPWLRPIQDKSILPKSSSSNFLGVKSECPWLRPIQDKGILQPKPTDFSPEKLEEDLSEECCLV
jgi:hypothetical protein